MTHTNIFLSHSDNDRDIVKSIAGRLAKLGFKPFVSSSHIQPASEWRHQLEAELASSAVLVALLTASFRASAWTDQEIGYALGQNKKIISVQLDGSPAPHGFLERYQAIRVTTTDPEAIAIAILDALLATDGDIGLRLRNVVISELREERSDKILHMWAARLSRLQQLSPSERQAVLRAIELNPVLRSATSLNSSLRELATRRLVA